MVWTASAESAARQIRFRPGAARRAAGGFQRHRPHHIRIGILKGEVTWGSAKTLFFRMIFVGALAASAAAHFGANAADCRPNAAQRGRSTAATAPVTTVNQAVDRIIAREHDEIATIRRYSPIIETYIQDMKPDKDMGAVPVRDHYFLGQADLLQGRGRQLHDLGQQEGQARRAQSDRPLGRLLHVVLRSRRLPADDLHRYERARPAALPVRLRAPRVPGRCPLRGVRRDAAAEIRQRAVSRAASGPKTRTTPSFVSTACTRRSPESTASTCTSIAGA